MFPQPQVDKALQINRVLQYLGTGPEQTKIILPKLENMATWRLQSLGDAIAAGIIIYSQGKLIVVGMED